MKSGELISTAAIFFLSLFLAGGGLGALDDGYQEITEKRMTLKWKVEGTSLLVKVSAPTTGWVSVGFDPVREMRNADIIIGYVKDGRASIRDDFGVDEESHQSDLSLGGKDNVADPGGREGKGLTEISFAIPLDSGDPYDRPLVPGREYKVILAYGPDGSDNFEEKHQKRTRVKIKI